MSRDEPATKQDVEDIVDRVVHRVVGDIVGGIVGDAMQLVSERFDKVDQQFTTVRSDLNRIENKLDATVDRVDDHEIRLKKLEHKAA